MTFQNSLAQKRRARPSHRARKTASPSSPPTYPSIHSVCGIRTVDCQSRTHASMNEKLRRGAVRVEGWSACVTTGVGNARAEGKNGYAPGRHTQQVGCPSAAAEGVLFTESSRFAQRTSAL